MRRIAIFSILIISISFLCLYLSKTNAVDLDSEYAFDVTIVISEDEILKPFLELQPYGQSVSLNFDGLSIDEKEFSFYIINNQIVFDYNYEFLVTSNTKVTAVFTNGRENAAVFMDTNGEFISIDYVDDMTTPIAPDVSKISKPGLVSKGFGLLEPITEHKIFVLEYINIKDSILVNGVPYEYNSIVTLVAESENFTHWMIDGVIVSYNRIFKFSALKDVDVIESEGLTSKTFITLTDDLNLREDEKYQTFLGRFELEDGETLIEAGIIASDMYINDLNLSTASTMIVSNSIHPITNEFLRTIESNTFAVVRGYLVTDKGVYYSDPQVVLEEVEYNFYVTLGTLPTLYAGLAMFEKEVESYAWYFRSGTFNTNYLPDYVNFFPEPGSWWCK